MLKVKGLTSTHNRLLQYFFHVALCLLVLCSELVLAVRDNLTISFYLCKRYLITSATRKYQSSFSKIFLLILCCKMTLEVRIQ